MAELNSNDLPRAPKYPRRSRNDDPVKDLRRALRLEFLSSGEISTLQSTRDPVLLLPTGATEQHGDHLPVNTDTFIGERLCWSASIESEAVVLPALPYTVSSGHTSKWPGTFSLSHETFIHAIEELSNWCAATGWKKLLIVNSHFGNNASLGVAVEKIRLKQMGTLQIGVVHSFTLTKDIWALFSADVADLHANKAETDLMLYLAPELVNMGLALDDPDRTTQTVFSYPVSQTSLRGVTGSPSQACAEDGERLFQNMSAALVEIIKKATTEHPPLDADHWLPNLTP